MLLAPRHRPHRAEDRGAAVRRGARPARRHGDPAGARRGQGRDLRPLHRLVARVPGVGARARRAGRPDAERVGDAGAVPRPRDPAAPRARGRAAPVAGGARPDRDGGPGLPREGLGRVPSDRRGAPGAVRRRRCRRAARPGARGAWSRRCSGCSASGRTTAAADETFPVLSRVPGQEHAIGVPAARGRPAAPRVRARRTRGRRQVPRGAGVRGGAALQGGRMRRVPGLPARPRRPSPERGRRRARGTRHPRRHGPRRGVASGLPHRARSPAARCS